MNINIDNLSNIIPHILLQLLTLLRSLALSLSRITDPLVPLLDHYAPVPIASSSIVNPIPTLMPQPFSFAFRQQHQPYRNCTQILYIDCRNWFDFSQELLSVILAFVLFLRVAKHYRNLKKQKQQDESEHQKSVRRKIAINLLIILYLLFFICNTIFDMYLFFMYKQAESRAILYGTLDKIYKISQVVYINLLNCLNLAVGLLYWKATRAYYVLSQLEVPKLYRRSGKYVFAVLFVFIFSAVSIAPIFLFVLHGDNEQHNRDFAIFTLVSTLVSIVMCIGCRIMYRRHILTKIQLSSSAVKKERVISMLLFTSSILRLVVYSLDIGISDWAQLTRHQQLSEQDGSCRDTWPYYAFVLLSINLFVNLLPAAVYGHLFVSQVDYRLKGSTREGLRDRGRRLFKSGDKNKSGAKSGNGNGSRKGSGSGSLVIDNDD